MTHIASSLVSGSVLMSLVASAIRALALSGVTGLTLATFRIKSTTVRLFSWTIVLYAAITMPALQWMLPAVPVPAPASFKSTAKQAISSSGANVVPTRSKGARSEASGNVVTPIDFSGQFFPSASQIEPQNQASTHRASHWFRLIPWTSIFEETYLAITLVLMARFLLGVVLGYRLLRASHHIADPRLAAKLRAGANSSGFLALPRIAESESVSVPLTIGMFRSTILLPRNWREWDDAKLEAVVAHEMSHVTRLDGLTQRLSVLHRTIFWFSPLAWWLERNLADLAEQAADEAALTSGVDRKNYAQTLLGFFEVLQAAPGRVRWQGVSIAKPGQAEKRLERILSWKGTVAMHFKKSIAVAVLTIAVPVVYLAASVHAAKAFGQAPPLARQPEAPVGQPSFPAPPAAVPAAMTPSEATPPPEPEIAPSADGLPTIAPDGREARAGVAPVRSPMPQTAPTVPTVPTVPPVLMKGRHGTSGSSSGHGFSYAYGSDDEQRFVIVSGKSDSFTMSGSSEDAHHVEKLRKQIPGDFIWFQRDEKSYIIRDQATIERARKLWAPQEELGQKQEALGKQQEELGKQQEALGRRMEEIHVNVPDMTAQLDKLKAELKQLNSNATVEQVGHIQSEIGELQSRIGEVQSQAGDQQSNLGEEMGALGEKQGKLGEQQGELGRQQGELAEQASKQMKQLLDEAIAKNLAQPEL
jgi:beta-lactamase regulating signal transducer with metallopeptidase domain